MAGSGGAGYQVPVEVARVRLASPPVDAHPVATVPLAPGQFASERVAFGVANGEKEPATVPFFTVILVKAAAPVTENADAWVHLVGLLLTGEVQVILNFPTGAGSAMPLKIVAQLFALPGMLNVSLPAMAPRTWRCVVVTHGFVVLPKAALTIIVSVLAVPPFMRGGVKLISPFHAPCVALHLTLPGRFTPAGFA